MRREASVQQEKNMDSFVLHGADDPEAVVIGGANKDLGHSDEGTMVRRFPNGPSLRCRSLWLRLFPFGGCHRLDDTAFVPGSNTSASNSYRMEEDTWVSNHTREIASMTQTGGRDAVRVKSWYHRLR
jgi:hypothetical protein